MFKEFKKAMSEFLNDIEAKIKSIHLTNGVDNQTVAKEIADAVKAAFDPVNDQITTLQGQVADLQKAAQDTVAALQAGDTDTALSTATAAAGTGTTGDGTAAIAGQAVS